MNMKLAYPGMLVAVRLNHVYLGTVAMPAKIKKVTTDAGHAVSHQVVVIGGPAKGTSFDVTSRQVLGPWGQSYEDAWVKAVETYNTLFREELEHEVELARREAEIDARVKVLRAFIPADADVTNDADFDNLIFHERRYRLGRWIETYSVADTVMEPILDVLRPELRRLYE